ncbi:MAG: hypothetical protein AAGM67_00560, partial [Bacteroidota bacterium]
LNSNIDQFGSENHPLRRRIQNRVFKLQKKHRDGKYLAYLATHQVVPFAKRPIISTIPSSQVDQASLSSGSTSDESLAHIPEPRPVPKARRGVQKSRPKEVSFARSTASGTMPEVVSSSFAKMNVSPGSSMYYKEQKPTKEIPDSASKSFLFFSSSVMFSAHISLISPSARVVVDLASPVQTRDIYVFEGHLPYVADKKKNFPGFFVMLGADDRRALDTKTKWYECHVVGRNELLIKCDAYSLPLSNDSDLAMIKAHMRAQDMNTSLFEALTVQKNKSVATADAEDEALLKDADKSRFSYYHLIFPEEMELSAKHVNLDAGDLEECNMEIIPVKYFPLGAANLKTNVKMFVYFEVCRIDIGYKDSAEKKDPKTESDRAAKKAAAASSAY